MWICALKRPLRAACFQPASLSCCCFVRGAAGRCLEAFELLLYPLVVWFVLVVCSDDEWFVRRESAVALMPGLGLDGVKVDGGAIGRQWGVVAGVVRRGVVGAVRADSA